MTVNTCHLKALSTFPESIFSEADERRSQLTEVERTGSATRPPGRPTDWKIGCYSEQFCIAKEVEWSTWWGFSEDATSRWRP